MERNGESKRRPRRGDQPDARAVLLPERRCRRTLGQAAGHRKPSSRGLVRTGRADAWLMIVGVVAEARNDGLRNPVKPAVFIPYTLSMSQGTQILARSDVPPLTLMHAVGKQVSAVNPKQQIYNNVEDLSLWIAEEPEWQQDHLVSWIFGLFAV